MNFHSSLFLLWQSLLQVRCQLYLKGEGRECSKRPTSAAAMYLTRISSLTMQVNRSCFNHSLCFGKDADVQTEWDLFRTSHLVRINLIYEGMTDKPTPSLQYLLVCMWNSYFRAWCKRKCFSFEILDQTNWSKQKWTKQIGPFGHIIKLYYCIL